MMCTATGSDRRTGVELLFHFAIDQDGSVPEARDQIKRSVNLLRSSLKAMQECKETNHTLKAVIRAAARALMLLYPHVQTEGPLLLVARTKGSRSRRQPQVSRRKKNRLPTFEVQLGEHSETILDELGYDADAIAKLRDDGVLP